MDFLQSSGVSNGQGIGSVEPYPPSSFDPSDLITCSSLICAVVSRLKRVVSGTLDFHVFVWLWNDAII